MRQVDKSTSPHCESIGSGRGSFRRKKCGVCVCVLCGTNSKTMKSLISQQKSVMLRILKWIDVKEQSKSMRRNKNKLFCCLDTDEVTFNVSSYASLVAWCFSAGIRKIGTWQIRCCAATCRWLFSSSSFSPSFDSQSRPYSEYTRYGVALVGAVRFRNTWHRQSK